ncbi:MAG: glycosyl transferase group 1 [Frankiales bacterium]|nr:glycosyl transferase group 1 [Frankiales bacterium]
MSALRELLPPSRQRVALDREVSQAAKLERRVLDDFDLVVTVSQEDADMLPGPSLVIPNGVDPQAFVPSPLGQGRHVVFTGTLSYLPNVDGLSWFCREVLPLIQADVPDVVFDVVGRDAVPQVRALADGRSVVLHPDVPAVQPYLDAARVCVVPLRIGTGSRLKALEAMASGRPVAGTTMGLMGLDLTDQAVVADEPRALADGVVQLLNDDALAGRLAAAGRAHVEEAFAWTTLGSTLVDQVSRLNPG